MRKDRPIIVRPRVRVWLKAEEVAKEAAAAGVLEEEAMQYVSTKKEIFEETKKINKFKEVGGAVGRWIVAR